MGPPNLCSVRIAKPTIDVDWRLVVRIGRTEDRLASDR